MCTALCAIPEKKAGRKEGIMYQINFSHPIRVHFIGIGGISMSGLAEVLLNKGFTVSGSDMHASALTEKLAGEGAKIFLGQQAGNVEDGIDCVVYTAAVHPDNPEFAECVRRKLPMLSRAELLGQLMRNYQTAIAVSGTHGKTTTTSMITGILLEAEADPTISVGGMLDCIGGNIRIGGSGTFVTEACEYTNSFLSFFPTTGIILNVRADHLDFFKDLDDIRHSFRRFAELIPAGGSLILWSGIENAEYFTKDLPCRIIRFGDKAGDDYRMEALEFEKGSGCPSFDIVERGQKLGRIELSVPGEHNALNALAAAACARDMGIDFESIRRGLASFGGAHRRFEVKGSLPGDIMVVDDYAHHPDEIRATLAAAGRLERHPIVCVFQPHTYSRTKQLMDEFADALCLADEVVLAKIYPARETDDLGISSRDLAGKIAEKGRKVSCFETFSEIEDFLQKNLLHGAMLITMGAGDVDQIGKDLLSR